jgi:hypothetical protein
MLIREVIEVMVETMGPHIGETMARSATEAHSLKLGIDSGTTVSSDQLEALLARLSSGLNIFLGREKAAAVVADARAALSARGATS